MSCQRPAFRWLLHALVLLTVALAAWSAPAAHAQSDDGEFAWVRLTWYFEDGITFGGGHTFAGSTACSWNWPLSTVFVFRDGESVVCNDRGMLGGAPGWLDVWRQPELVRRYGRYALVEVIEP